MKSPENFFIIVGVKLVKCESEYDALKILRDSRGANGSAGGNSHENATTIKDYGSGGRNNLNDDDGDCNDKSTDGPGRDCQVPPVLVHISACLLHHPGHVASATPLVLSCTSWN